MIEIKNLSVKIGEFSLRDINLKIQDREYLIILGPTGAGKTVLMECLAGLHRIKQGEIWIKGTNITHLPPEERKIGYVPQDYVMFPFLNVEENILFGLKHGKYEKIAIRRRRLKTLTDLLGINHLLSRDTRTLSGGEKQRVALARALATQPSIILMDEPFSALDVQTSDYLRLELRRLHKELGVTAVHITHNHKEAREMADRIAVLISGRIAQVGRTDDIFFAPENEAVSRFVGSSNILESDSCRQLVPGLLEVTCGEMHIVLPHDEGTIEKIAIAPRDVYITDVLSPGPSLNRYKGVILAINRNSTTAKLDIDIVGIRFKAEVPGELAAEMNLAIGKEVYVILRLQKLKVLGKKRSFSSTVAATTSSDR